MKESTRSTEEIIKDIVSRDTTRVWGASCEICSWSQNHNKIIQLIPYYEQIISSSRGLNLGGALAPNSRFLKKAIEIIYFHMGDNGCPCCLLSEDSNPLQLIEDGYFALDDTYYIGDSSCVDSYDIHCKACGSMYQVAPREYHYIWWEWTFLGKP
ncbi:hypothetical protein [Amedibacillus sp. YH-ame10]